MNITNFTFFSLWEQLGRDWEVIEPYEESLPILKDLSVSYNPLLKARNCEICDIHAFNVFWIVTVRLIPALIYDRKINPGHLKSFSLFTKAEMRQFCAAGTEVVDHYLKTSFTYYQGSHGNLGRFLNKWSWIYSSLSRPLLCITFIFYSKFLDERLHNYSCRNPRSKANVLRACI